MSSVRLRGGGCQLTMADPRPSARGRLITFAVFGGLFALAVFLMWYYWTRVRGVDIAADASSIFPFIA
jgi:hypothetical protein